MNTLTKISFLFILLLNGCASNDKEKAAPATDSLTVEMDTALFLLKDSTWVRPDGNIPEFRYISIINNTAHDIFLEKPFENLRVIKGCADYFFSSRHKVWTNPYKMEWEPGKDCFTLKPGKKEKFMVADPFADGDTILFILDVSMDQSQQKIYRYSQYFYTDRKRGVIPMDETPVSLKNQKRKE